MGDDDSIKTFEGHTFIVCGVRFSLNNRFLISGSRDGTIKFWNIETGEVEKTLESGGGEIRTIDSLSIIASADDEDKINIWTENGDLLNTIKTENTVNCIKFDKMGHLLYGCELTTWKCWNVYSGALIKTVETGGEVLNSIAITNTVIATGDQTNELKLWSRTSGELIRELKGHNGNVNGLAFSWDGLILVSGSDDGTVKAWDVKTGKNLWTANSYGGGLHSIAMSSNNEYVVSGASNNEIHILKLSNGEVVNILKGHSDTIWGITISYDSEYIASASEDQTVKLWKLEEGEIITNFLGLSESDDEDEAIESLFGDNEEEDDDDSIGSLFGGDARDSKKTEGEYVDNFEVLAETKNVKYTIKEIRTAPKCLATSKSGKYLAYGCYDNSIKLFDLKEGRHIKTFIGHESEVEAVAFLPSEEHIISCSSDKTIKRWNIKSGKLGDTIEEPEQLVSVVVTSDGQYIIAGSGAGYIKVWDMWTNSMRKELKNLSGGVNQVIASPDGKQIIAGLVDKTIRVWDFLTGKETRKFEGHIGEVLSIAISRNRKYLISGGGDGDYTVKVWNYETGELLKTIKDHLKAVYKVAISPYGKYFASCSTDSNVHIYELPSHRKIRTFEHEGEWVNSVIFSPDGVNIISSSDERLIRVWKFPEGKTEKKDVKSLNKVLEYLEKAKSLYDNISFAQMNKRTQVNVENLHEIIEDLIFNGELEAKIQAGHLIFRGELGAQPTTIISEPSGLFQAGDVHVLRGGDWKVEGSYSIFYYKVKVKNDSKFLIGNIQIILTSIPRGLEVGEQMYKIESLKPGSFESPSFKLKAQESCVGDTVEGIVTFTDPMGKQQTLPIEPFEICYVCNLLTPKEISKAEFDEKVEFMEDKKLIIDSDLDLTELESKIASIVQNCNFAMLNQLQENKSEDFRKFEAFAEGLYDKQDVALSIAVKKVKKEAKKGAKKGSKLVIKAMSDRSEKVTDLLKDFNIKLDDIKSDTELIKQYSSQIEDIFEQSKDLEKFLMDKLGSDFQQIKHVYQSFKSGEIGKGGLIKEGLKIIGKKFIKKIIGTM